MKKTFAIFLAALMLLGCLAGCGDKTPASGSDIPASGSDVSTPEPAPEAAGVGSYTFIENALGGAFEVPFTVELKEDGSFTVTEDNPMMGQQVYTGSSYQWHDSYFVTGPFDGDERPMASWFEADGSCTWIINGEGQVTPMNYVASEEQPAGETGETKALAYADDSKSQVLDVYLPEGEGPHPVIVVLHGGGFKFGDQAMSIIQPIFEATEQGYAVVSVDYRKSMEAPFPAALADAKAAVRWVRANAETYGFDPDRIAIWGESAGAYLAIMTALTPDVEELNGDVDENRAYSSAVQALVSFYAPINFWELDADAETVGMTPSFGGAGSFESDFVGQAVGADESFTKQTWWGSYTDCLPEDFTLSAWVQVGDSDHRVPYVQSVHFAEELAAVIGADSVTFGIVEGADHEDALFYTEENLNAVYAFLDEVLN
ncbi:MAG: alpha/beta fold hydrolase [Oscillospiraceae bacterium]